MLTRRVVLLCSLLTTVSSACSQRLDDKTIRSSVVGVWTWNPRLQLPADKIENDTGIYATPDQQILQFTASVAADHDRGEFAEYRHVPTNKNMKEDWVIWRRGPWSVLHAEIEIQGRLETTLKVLRVSATELRVTGVGFGCKDGRTLRRLNDVPEAAKAGRTF